MYLFRRPHYISDAGLFLDELKRNNPALEAQQHAGRAIFWEPAMLADAAEHAALQKGFCAANVPQQPYVYATRA